MPSDPDKLLIESERIRFVCRELPLTISVGVINAALTAVALAPVTDHIWLGVWLGLQVGLAVGRAFMGRRYLKLRPEGAETGIWAAGSVAGALMAGILWGGGMTLMFPVKETTQLFIAFVIGGMCAGATTVSFSHYPTAIAFILPASLPLALAFFYRSGGAQTISTLMIVIFALALCAAAVRAHTGFGDRMRLQFALARQRRKLGDANRRLQSEMAERKTIEESLHHAQKMEAIGHLTGGIAHDFNNLLQVIVGNLNLIRRQSGGNSKVLAYTGAAEQAAQRGAELTGSLLSYARRQAMHTEQVDLNRLLTEFQPLLLRTLGGRIDFDMRLDPGIPACKSDPAHFQSAILNLVINARDAMPDGGTLSVTSGLETLAIHDLSGNPEAKPGQFVSITVSDSGCGMTEDVLARVFEPFFTTKEVGKGSGLGLSQVFGFARQSAGHVRLVSAPGAGTRATISLPVLVPAPEPGTRTGGEAVSQGVGS